MDYKLKFIYHSLGRWKSEYQSGSLLVRALLWITDGIFFLYPHVGAREHSGVSFIRALIPLMRTLPSWPNHIWKASPPNTITLRVRNQHTNFERRPKYSVQNSKSKSASFLEFCLWCVCVFFVFSFNNTHNMWISKLWIHEYRNLEQNIKAPLPGAPLLRSPSTSWPLLLVTPEAALSLWTLQSHIYAFIYQYIIKIDFTIRVCSI